MNRRQFTLATASAGAALVCNGTAANAAPARAATAVATQFLWVKNVEYAGFYLADADGLFRNEGIAPAFLAGGPNLASVEAIVAGGRADVGVDEFEKIVDAVAHGADFVVFGAIYQRSIAGLLSLPKNPIRKAADILDKRIGLQQGAKIFIDGILRVNGLPPRYTEVPVGFDPDPLVQGACDGYLCYVTSQPLVLASRKIPYVLTGFAQLGYSVYAAALFCRRDYLQKNRDALVRYTRALARGWQANRRDPDRGATLAVSVYGAPLGLDLQQQIAQNKAQLPYLESPQVERLGLLCVSKDLVAGPIYKTLRATGRAELPDPNRLVDETIVRDAHAGR
jgi:ABC-type nitrate/sulfonate/bicarbonate transport system substrate-binding protein